MDKQQTLAAQRQLLDRLLLAGHLPTWRYLQARQVIADTRTWRVMCAHHVRIAAVIYAPDEHTPLCGPCGLAAYAEHSACVAAESSACDNETPEESHGR